MTISATLKKLMRNFGFSINRVRPNTDAWARRAVLIEGFEIDLVLDIGAFVGSYGVSLRDAGYSGRIFSFEPQPDGIHALQATAAASPPWKVFQLALSDYDGQSDFLVSNRRSSSSLYQMNSSAQVMANAQFDSTITVRVAKLDSILEENDNSFGNIYVKCDAQGAEREIIRGARNTLSRAMIVEIELSIAEMYEGQWDFREALMFFEESGFGLYSLEPGFADPVTGRVMQVDAIFTKLD